ncbi:MAG: hypothetical protein ACYDAQ_05770, partial [Mycobacteriales bacterium]
LAHDRTNHDQAVANSRALFLASRRAGVQRIVHVSITHPSIDSPFPYFRGTSRRLPDPPRPRRQSGPTLRRERGRAA